MSLDPSLSVFLVFWSALCQGLIALEIAAFLGHTEVVELLARQRGPLLQNHSAMVLGNALRHAAQNGHSAALHLLSKLGNSAEI